MSEDLTAEACDMRIRVLRTRTLTPDDRRTAVRFVAGWEGTTKRAWGEVLVVDGDAEEIAIPARLPPPKPADPLDHDRDGHKGGSVPGQGRRRAPASEG